MPDLFRHVFKTHNVNTHYKEIQEQLVRGDTSGALEQAIKLARSQPNDATAMFLLASAQRASRQVEPAKTSIKQALLIQPFHPAYHTLFAEIQLDDGLRDAARASLQNALKAKPDYAVANSLMGVIEMEDSQPARALPFLEKAAKADTATAQHKNNLGVALLALNRERDAETAFAAAVKTNADYFTARFNLVRALIKRGADRAAATHLQVLLNQQPNHQECLFLVGNICHRNGDFATAADYLRRAAEQQPVNPPIVNAFAEFCWEQGDTATAIGLYNISAQAEPANVRAALGRYLCLPMVAESAAALTAARERFGQGLDSLERQLAVPDQRPVGMRVREVQWTNFLLAYQGENDVDLQRRYAGIVTKLMQAALPQHAGTRPSTLPNKGEKIRVGFISDHFYSCTAGRYFESWVTGLPKGKYDIHVYNGSTTKDALTQRIEGAAQKVRDIYAMELGRLADLIADDDLDVLVFPEMGMHPQIFPLGALRLARVQVAGWGHPVTTGFANMDYFLSSADMEPADAQDHYSEKLQLLPGLGTCYQAPASEGPVAERTALGLPAAGALYLVPQSLYKIHPDNDAILADVLKRDPAGTLVMFATERHRVATSVFVKRLQAALEHARVAPEGRVKMLPQTSHEQYLAINRLCNVMLDTIRWSGGNTTLDALAVGLPVITTEGKTMRARQSAAMLRMVGVPELVLASPAQLAEQAVALANDPGKLSELHARIAKGRSALFDQTAPLVALDGFLTAVTNEARSEQSS